MAEGETCPFMLFVVAPDSSGNVLAGDSKSSNGKVAVKGASAALRVRCVEGDLVS